MTANVSKQTAYVVMLSPLIAVSKQTAYIFMVPATDTISASATFGVEIAFSADSSDLGEETFPTAAFRLEIGLTATGELFPRFACPEPEPKTWARQTVAEKFWVCATVVPAEDCDGIEVGANDDLDLVDGDRLVTLDGFGLKLVS